MIDENKHYYLAIDPSKNSSGIVLLSSQYQPALNQIKVSLELTRTVTTSNTSKHIKNYNPVTSVLTRNILNVVKDYHLNRFNCDIVMENEVIGRNTSPLLYHLFQSIIEMFSNGHQLCNPINIHTYLPMTLKAFIKCFSDKKYKGVIEKPHILEIFQNALSVSGMKVPSPALFQNDILDAYFLALMGVIFSPPMKWLCPFLTYFREHEMFLKQIRLQLQDILPALVGDIPLTQDIRDRILKFEKALHQTYSTDSYTSKFYYPNADSLVLEFLIKESLDLNPPDKDSIKTISEILNTSPSYVSSYRGMTDMPDLSNPNRGFKVSYNNKGFFIYVPEAIDRDLT